MKKFWLRVKKSAKTSRRGFSLVELLIAVVVLGILSSMLIAAGTASQNKARMAVAQNDLDSIKNSVYQALMAHPNVMKLKDDNKTFNTLIGYLNSELDDAWRIEMISSTTTDGSGTGTAVNGSGLVAQTATQKDPWGNPYGIYIYTNEHKSAYKNVDGTTLGGNDSCMYIVVTSAGRNSTGGPLGADGTNYDSSTGKITSAANAVNNSDGIDDLGVIIRIKNGTLLTASFGTEQCTLGTMAGYQWIYGIPGTGGGVIMDYDSNTAKTATAAGSIDECIDKATIDTKYGSGTGKLKVVGAW